MCYPCLSMLSVLAGVRAQAQSGEPVGLPDSRFGSVQVQLEIVLDQPELRQAVYDGRLAVAPVQISEG